MEQKEYDRRVKLFSILKTLDHIDPDGIPIYSYEEMEAVKRRKEHFAIFLGVFMGMVVGIALGIFVFK